MPVGRPTAERFQQIQRILEEYHAAPDAEVVNEREMASEDEPRYLKFHNRYYRVPPIPYKDGLRLGALVREYGTASDDGDVAGQERALSALAKLYSRLAVPTGIRRLVRWVLPNPFRKASEKELTNLADFFWKCRTGKSLYVIIQEEADRRSSTASATSTNLRGTTTDARSTGPTSSAG